MWAALDADTRQVVAMVAGGRDEFTARCLWDALPEEYRTDAVVCTDFLTAYRAVVPEERHAAGKDAGLTAHIERFRLTLRQRVGRFVRKTLSFSKCPRNHLGALWDFVRHYNASLQYGHYRDPAAQRHTSEQDSPRPVPQETLQRLQPQTSGARLPALRPQFVTPASPK